MQIETLEAVDNIEAIAAVDGVDALFVGPSDLSASMGFIGQPGHPEVKAKIEEAACGLDVLTKSEHICRLLRGVQSRAVAWNRQEPLKYKNTPG